MFQYISWRIEWYWMWEATWNGSAGFTVSRSKGSQVCFTLPTPKRLPRLQMPLQDAVRRRELHDVYDVLTCHGLLRCVVQVQSNLKQVQVRRIPASFRIQSQTRLASWLACWPHEDGGTNVDSLLFVLVLEGWACQWMSGRQRRNWDSAIALDTGYRWLQIFPPRKWWFELRLTFPNILTVAKSNVKLELLQLLRLMVRGCRIWDESWNSSLLRSRFRGMNLVIVCRAKADFLRFLALEKVWKNNLWEPGVRLQFTKL